MPENFYSAAESRQKIQNGASFSEEELRAFITEPDKYRLELAAAADKVRRLHYGNKIFIRGLIEISNYCKNNCFYCGLRFGNKFVERYRLSKQEILDCCRTGYALGFRTFVLQGGEDYYFTEKRFCEIIHAIKTAHSNCAVTLSVGEKKRHVYQAYFDAGADRYLLRHETAAPEHYALLHPNSMSLDERKRCLYNLKEIGFQVGSGFMVGSPFQTAEHLLADLRFLQELQPDMIGIGPYLNHPQTPFKDSPNGSMELTLCLISLLRLLFPTVLLPSTTALATVHPHGRELGLKAGANVVMPNLSPPEARKNYTIYANKACTGTEAAQNLQTLQKLLDACGYEISVDRGDRKHI